jgi:hypothetical protein
VGDKPQTCAMIAREATAISYSTQFHSLRWKCVRLWSRSVAASPQAQERSVCDDYVLHAEACAALMMRWLTQELCIQGACIQPQLEGEPYCSCSVGQQTVSLEDTSRNAFVEAKWKHYALRVHS